MKSDGQEEQLRDAEGRRIKALLHHDIEALKELLHPAITYGHGSGLADTYDSYIEKLASGKMRYICGTSSISKISSLGSVGLVWALVTMEAQIGSDLVQINNAILGVWTMDAGQWRMVAHQPTRIPG